MIALPSAVYGPGDHSQLGDQLRQAGAGKLPFVSFPKVGVSFVHVDGVADGLARVLRQGRDGRCYVIAGEVARLATPYAPWPGSPASGRPGSRCPPC